MARRKNHPETVRVKCHLAERMREIRIELYGERGGSEMARRLGVPIRTWYNYESGVTVPAEVLLKFMELTSVEPRWLLHGEGEKFRAAASLGGPSSVEGSATVEALLRTALQQLEKKSTNGLATIDAPACREARGNGHASHGSNGSNGEAQSAWIEAERQGRCVLIDDDAMAPILARGARVVFAAEDEPMEMLEGAMVVLWVKGRPQVRWFRCSGGYGLLRAENTEYNPGILLLDLKTPPDERRIRRVLWTSTPH